jgi:arginine/serine-rich splicing factor 17
MKPSESMLRAVFEVFGPLRTVDIPMLDPYRPKMVSNPPNTFAFGQDGLFEAFIQYQEYVGFLKCMTAFRGMKLLYKEGNRAWTALVQVIDPIQR